MINDKPILIAGPPRSGTTMLAGLFYHHGAWIGKARITDHPATNSALGTENIEIKKYLKSLLGGYKNWTVPLPDINTQNHAEFKQDISSLIETDSFWLVKTANILFTWQLWDKAFPNAVWIFPQRGRESVIASALKHPVMKKHGRLVISRFITACQERQAYIAQYVKGVFVDVNTIVTSAEFRKTIIKQTGLDYCQEKADNWINPNLWHETKNA